MTFKPTGKEISEYGHLTFSCTRQFKFRVQAAADKANTSRSEFIRQAIEYALDNMEQDDG